LKCINSQEEQEKDEEKNALTLTAMAAFSSMRRIMDVLVADKELLAQIEPILYPCLQHTLTLDGLYRTGEGAYMIT